MTFKRNKLLYPNPDIIWCQNKNCDKFYDKYKSLFQNIRCSCGKKLCYECGSFNYKNCVGNEEMKEWNKSANAKPCPSCKISIEDFEITGIVKCTYCDCKFCYICDDIDHNR